MRIRPDNLRIVQKAECVSSEWIPWRPPEEMVRATREAVEGIERMMREDGDIPVEVDALRQRCITMFKTVWRARARGKESTDNLNVLERMRVTASAQAQSVVSRIEEVILMGERWEDSSAEKTVEAKMMNCSRCLEDAIQQGQTGNRSVKA